MSKTIISLIAIDTIAVYVLCFGNLSTMGQIILLVLVNVITIVVLHLMHDINYIDEVYETDDHNYVDGVYEIDELEISLSRPRYVVQRLLGLGLAPFGYLALWTLSGQLPTFSLLPVLLLGVSLWVSALVYSTITVLLKKDTAPSALQ